MNAIYMKVLFIQNKVLLQEKRVFKYYNCFEVKKISGGCQEWGLGGE